MTSDYSVSFYSRIRVHLRKSTEKANTYEGQWTDLDRERIAQMNTELGKLILPSSRDLVLENSRALDSGIRKTTPGLRDAAPKRNPGGSARRRPRNSETIVEGEDEG